MALRATAVLARPDASAPEIGAPAVRAVDALLRRAIALHASDIHVEPARGGGCVRFRIDGILRPTEPLAAELYAPVISRLKLLAGIDIANRRVPQDGRYAASIDGQAIDARVASMPTLDGEKLAIRLLESHHAQPRLDELGMEPAALAMYRAAARAPWGFVVISGPTGSGKTTTLYASLAELDRQTRNVCTVEDPIERRLAGATQVQVNVRAGLTFPAVLRAFVRQDPDVIAIGEMRDAETGAVGVAAALAGQTVFATVHSNDAPRTIDRLIELGVARASLAAGLTVVVAQRLVRTLCMHCRGRVSGCAACEGTRYLGRTAAFEVLEIDDDLRDAIAAGASSATLARMAAATGHRTLADDVRAKLAAGIIDREELVRVIGAAAA